MNYFLKEESKYLAKTIEFLKSEIKRLSDLLSDKKSTLKTSRKQMWEDTAHSSSDFTKLIEANQYLSEVNNQTASYIHTLKQVDKYKKMLNSPYFGRFDFIEDGTAEREKIYIGLYNVMDPRTHDILVYDWRAPISSVFYQYELGKAFYNAPFEVISGEVKLKRQYKIRNEKLEYFFDCNVAIEDKLLKDALSQSSSPRMKSIVETIQRDQDIIIRDIENEVLIVQGVAGSGKTTIALHRIAFLLYPFAVSGTPDQNIISKNILIISPNPVFSKYISSVLPELGEENVTHFTFEDYALGMLKEKGNIEARSSQIEFFISPLENHEEKEIRKLCVEFKNSDTFLKILDRLILFYQRKIVDFQDVYCGEVIISKQQLKNLFLSDISRVPAMKRLKRIEESILKKYRYIQKKRLEKIKLIVSQTPGHELEVIPYSRILSFKISKEFSRKIRINFKIDYYKIYKYLFEQKGILKRLSYSLDLPTYIDHIINFTKNNLETGRILYEDSAALLYIKLRLEGNNMFSNVKQVVIDEAQDYSSVHYNIFGLLFKNANYTILGDVNQSLERNVDLSIYETIINIFKRKKSLLISLDKSYRSSFEIITFAQGFLNRNQDIVPFERHEASPTFVCANSMDELMAQIIRDVEECLKQGYQSIAIVCKTIKQSDEVYEGLSKLMDVKLVNSREDEIEKGCIIILGYMMKGLEFDVVLVVDVSRESYCSDLDRKLLYIISTRALHRLGFYYVQHRSNLLNT